MLGSLYNFPHVLGFGGFGVFWKRGVLFNVKSLMFYNILIQDTNLLAVE